MTIECRLTSSRRSESASHSHIAGCRRYINHTLDQRSEWELHYTVPGKWHFSLYDSLSALSAIFAALRLTTHNIASLLHISLGDCSCGWEVTLSYWDTLIVFLTYVLVTYTLCFCRLWRRFTSFVSVITQQQLLSSYWSAYIISRTGRVSDSLFCGHPLSSPRTVNMRVHSRRKQQKLMPPSRLSTALCATAQSAVLSTRWQPDWHCCCRCPAVVFRIQRWWCKHAVAQTIYRLRACCSLLCMSSVVVRCMHLTVPVSKTNCLTRREHFLIW